jgi:hypothetical protein
MNCRAKRFASSLLALSEGGGGSQAACLRRQGAISAHCSKHFAQFGCTFAYWRCVELPPSAPT